MTSPRNEHPLAPAAGAIEAPGRRARRHPPGATAAEVLDAIRGRAAALDEPEQPAF